MRHDSAKAIKEREVEGCIRKERQIFEREDRERRR